LDFKPLLRQRGNISQKRMFLGDARATLRSVKKVTNHPEVFTPIEHGKSG